MAIHRRDSIENPDPGKPHIVVFHDAKQSSAPHPPAPQDDPFLKGRTVPTTAVQVTGLDRGTLLLSVHRADLPEPQIYRIEAEDGAVTVSGAPSGGEALTSGVDRPAVVAVTQILPMSYRARDLAWYTQQASRLVGAVEPRLRSLGRLQALDEVEATLADPDLRAGILKDMDEADSVAGGGAGEDRATALAELYDEVVERLRAAIAATE